MPTTGASRRTLVRCVLAAAAFVGCGAAPALPAPKGLATRDAIAAALRDAKPGDRIEIAPGTYDGGLYVTGPRGTEKKPVVIAAADPEKPPVFRGGGEGLHLTGPEHVELSGLVFEGQTGNGLNIDDGGEARGTAHHVVLRNVEVRDVGPDGNRDGIKLSGLTDFRIEDCRVLRWGGGGQGIDMVGCRRGVIERCRLEHGERASNAAGVQAKGASEDVVVRRCEFVHAGSRAVNAGGSTGLEFFRPPLAEWKGPKYEARNVVVEGCTFVGSDAPVAFVGVDGATFRFNTVYAPRRWFLRILQETRADGFVPSRNAVVTDNVIVFRSDAWSEGGANCGPGTEPATSRFERNFWFCEDAPERTRSLVRMPVPEKDAEHGRDPKLRDPAKGDLRLAPGSPAAKCGADALPGAAARR